LALDSSGNPHISYFRQSYGGLKYARRAGEQWTIETIVPSWNVGSYTSLALDDADAVHISYYDGDYRYLKYIRQLPRRTYLPLVSHHSP
jgi:hypothetical protein